MLTSVVAKFKKAWPYAKDALNLPVKSVDEALPFYETVMGFINISRNCRAGDCEKTCRTSELTDTEPQIGRCSSSWHQTASVIVSVSASASGVQQ
jgi:hypothetical protein